MQAFDSVFHAYCLIGERRLVIDRWTVWYLGWVVHRNCSLKDGVLAAETTVRTRWWGAAYQMLRSIDYIECQ